jgi:3-hydroxyisobutyrate dehydrogenase-like beta-hydroxyacid dehydrogenase
MLKVGFIGLGNVGGKLAGSLLRNGVDLTVRDLDSAIAQPFLDGGAKWADSPREMAQNVDVLITCLPSPAASALVMEAEDGALTGFGPGKSVPSRSIARCPVDAIEPPQVTLRSLPVVNVRPSKPCCRC